jgi:glycosyltransferase involved in cell wall biosynthesis
VGSPKSLNISEFENGSVFLDIDSSWHSKLKREALLSTLKQQQIKLVKLHYDIIPLLFPDTSHPNTISVFEEHFQSHLKYTDLFLCISRQTLNDVTDYCANNALSPPALRTIRLGGGVSNTQHLNKPTTALPLASSGLSDFGQYILSVGTIEPRKNYPLLLDAFDQVSQNTSLNLVIVGKAGWLADAITARIKEHPAYGSRIHHLENISNLQLDALYRNAWVNVVPSLYEGFGLPVAEALARNCPTICSSAGSLPEVGGRHVRIFSPHVKSELIDTLMALSRDSAMYLELKRLAHEYTPNTWTQTAQDIDSCISEKVEQLEKTAR